jgi:2-dehydro-3-deoxyphosphogluconate aldolase / (4S)-4-hydroxy-2-oxoglutarate aldolase
MARRMSPDEVLSLTPVLPVAVLQDAANAAPLARALLAGGVRSIEITLRTAAALDAIRAVVEATPSVIVGAGTVLSEDDLHAAADAGAAFALSPGASRKLLKAARRGPIPMIPGVATASEIMEAMALGYTHFKFFPAEQLGGIAALKALEGPLPDARFCPTGGIGAEKAAAYLALDTVLCVGGSWLAPEDKIAAGDWAGIEALARQAAKLRR